MEGREVVPVLEAAAAAVRRALDGLDDWGPAGTRAGQYRSDLVADEACLAVLDDAGLGWLSEETGPAHEDRELVVIVDPVDGSTNASRGIPWFATSLCALDRDGALAAVVVNQATGRTYRAIRGEGATVDGVALRPTAVTRLEDAIIGIAGMPARPVGWRQFRALGAAALDLCAVAEGLLDGYLDASRDAHGAWDYAGGLLVCHEAGAAVADAFGRDLLTTDHAARRTPIAAATPWLLEQLVSARREARWPREP